MRIEWVSASEGSRFAKVIADFIRQVEEIGPLGRGEGEDGSKLAVKLEAAKGLVPYIKLIQAHKLRLPSGNAELAYEEFCSSDEVNKLFDELVGDKLAISQITALLRRRPHSTGEIADSLGLSPSEAARHMNESSCQGLVKYDVNCKCYTLA